MMVRPHDLKGSAGESASGTGSSEGSPEAGEGAVAGGPVEAPEGSEVPGAAGRGWVSIDS